MKGSACTIPFCFLYGYLMAEKKGFVEKKKVGLARSMEEIIPTNNTTGAPVPPPQVLELDSNNQRRARPQKDHNLNCPRCNSTNTKFCYYNNYSLTQPRYFCKTCRRYWTQGGSLRNVPVGGGSRKNKRSTPSSTTISSSSSSAVSSLSSIASTSSPSSATITSTAKLIPDLNPPSTLSHLIPSHHHHHQNPSSSKIHPHPHHHGQDLNLAFPTTTTQDYHSALLQSTELPKIEGKVELPNISCNTTTSPASASAPLSALELLRTGIASSSLSSYVPVPMPDSNPLYPSSGFPNMQDMKPSLMGFLGSSDGLGLGHRFNMGSLQENSSTGGQVNDGAARLLFPFGDINKFSSHHNASTTITAGHQVDSHQSTKGSTQDHHQGASGYWNGMLGGGTW